MDIAELGVLGGRHNIIYRRRLVGLLVCLLACLLARMLQKCWADGFYLLREHKQTYQL